MNKSYYIDDTGKLNDERIIKDLELSIELYKKGEVSETGDILSYIVKAIRKIS